MFFPTFSQAFTLLQALSSLQPSAVVLQSQYSHQFGSNTTSKSKKTNINNTLDSHQETFAASGGPTNDGAIDLVSDDDEVVEPIATPMSSRPDLLPNPRFEIKVEDTIGFESIVCNKRCKYHSFMMHVLEKIFGPQQVPFCLHMTCATGWGKQAPQFMIVNSWRRAVAGCFLKTNIYIYLSLFTAHNGW